MSETKLTHEEKVNYMRIATNLCRFGFDNKTIDLLVHLYEAVTDKGGDLTVRDTVHIEEEVKKRDNIKCRQELLDKVSEIVPES